MKTTGTKSKTGKTSSDAETGLRELFEDQLKDLYWAEKAFTKFMPKTVEKVTSQELIDALTEHMDVTKQQVTRLENVFELVGSKAKGEKCEAMDGLIKEAEDIIDSTEEGPVRDAGIIGAVQKVEHYEIASYGTLKSFANILGEHEAASLLEETLNEEKEADATLTELAESLINIEASGMEDEGGMRSESGSRSRSSRDY
jgi:ferritin-like metal-binding protein YciE